MMCSVLHIWGNTLKFLCCISMTVKANCHRCSQMPSSTPLSGRRNVAYTGLWSLVIALGTEAYSKSLRDPMYNILSVQAGTLRFFDVSYTFPFLLNLKVGGKLIFPSENLLNAAPENRAFVS